MKAIVSTTVATIALALPGIATAQLSVPEQINVQVLVLDQEGEPLSQSFPDAEVQLRDGEDSSSTIVWSDDAFGGVTVDAGLASIALEVANTNIFVDHPELWLHVNLSDDLMVEPRQVTSTPFAYFADEANHAATAAALDDCTAGTPELFLWDGSNWECSDAIQIDSDGSVDIGGTVTAEEFVGTGAIERHDATVTFDSYNWLEGIATMKSTLVVLNLANRKVVGVNVNVPQGTWATTHVGYVSWGLMTNFADNPPHHWRAIDLVQAEDGGPDLSTASAGDWPYVIVDAEKRGGDDSDVMNLVVYYAAN